MPLITTDEFYNLTGKSDTEIYRDMLEGLLDAASGMVEIKLARKLALGDYVQRRFHSGRVVLLEAYPVKEISRVLMDDKPVESWQLDENAGILRLPWHMEGLLQVEYRGGMEPIPMAIRQACALIALSLNSAIENSGQTVMSERLDGYQMMYYQPAQNGQQMSVSPAADALLTPWKNRRIGG